MPALGGLGGPTGSNAQWGGPTSVQKVVPEERPDGPPLLGPRGQLVAVTCRESSRGLRAGPALTQMPEP